MNGEWQWKRVSRWESADAWVGPMVEYSTGASTVGNILTAWLTAWGGCTIENTTENCHDLHINILTPTSSHTEWWHKRWRTICAIVVNIRKFDIRLIKFLTFDFYDYVFLSDCLNRLEPEGVVFLSECAHTQDMSLSSFDKPLNQHPPSHCCHVRLKLLSVIVRIFRIKRVEQFDTIWIWRVV